METKEKLIREEMQSLREAGFRLAAWGVSLLSVVEIALVFIRGLSYRRLLATKQLEEGQPLPLGRHLLGTLLLQAISAIFTGMTSIVSRRYRFYNNLLSGNNKESAVPVPAGTGGVGGLIVAMYFLFPVLDLLLWPYLLIVNGARALLARRG